MFSLWLLGCAAWASQLPLRQWHQATGTVKSIMTVLHPYICWASVLGAFVFEVILPVDSYTLGRQTPPGSGIFANSDDRFRMSVTLADIHMSRIDLHQGSHPL